MTSAVPRLFTIAPSRPFLPVLAGALLDGRLVPGFRPGRGAQADPLALASATILVPTRRSARALRAAFLDALGGRAAILPTIKPLGDVDEDLLVLDGEADFLRELTVELNGLERLAGMTRLVVGWSERLAGGGLVNPATAMPPTLPASPAEAVHLARALLHLLDQFETEGVDWTRLDGLVPEDHADWWALTLAFLKIVAEHWPEHLAQKGLVDPARRRNRMIRAEAERLKAKAPDGPVIAAGSTGSIPATADLLDVVARLPQGAVVLPGLDLELDDEAWAAIGTAEGEGGRTPVHGHPQYGLKLLLARLRAGRELVEPLDPEPEAPLRLRRRAVSEALKPAETTDSWKDFAPNAGSAALGEAFAEASLLEARGESEAALAIAVAMRSVLETEGRTAALVTPDRALARRVAAELGRWGLAIDDSAGVPLLATPPAVLARLVAEVATKRAEPVALVALLQHPLARFGLPRAVARSAGRVLEIAALRGPRPRPGLAGLAEAFAQARHEADTGTTRIAPARRRLSPRDWNDAEDLLDRLTAALEPLERLAAAPARAPFALYLEAHVAALRAVGADETGSDAALFEGEAGEALATMLAGLVTAARDPDNVVAVGGRDYPATFEAMIGHQPVRRRLGQDDRLHIWGPLEARLQSVDLLILAGLDEGVWPAAPESDPWLSRDMKARMGLEPPERRIGLAAHDFAQGASAPKVVLARSLRAGGTPTVASRWLQRLAAVVGEDTLAAMRERGQHWLSLARALDRPAGRPRPVARPEPRPPVEARPTRLSVTEIETWIRDPYAIYARHVLKLEPLDPLATPPDVGDRGSLVHAMLDRFMREWDPAASRTAALARLRDIAEEELASLSAFPEVVALWRPRLARMAEWFVDFELERSPLVAGRVLEGRAAMELRVGPVTFTLTGRADRIDRMADGRVAILDYKTGTPPSPAQVQCLLAPQLPLEAAMLRHGAFGEDLAAEPFAELLYVKLSGSGEGGKVSDVTAAGREAPGVPADDLAERAREKLSGLVALYADPAQGYPSRPRIQFSRQTDGTYDHLARVKEWAAGEEGEA